MQRPAIALVVAAGITLLLYWLPFGQTVALPLLWLSTLAHEAGHGLAAVATGGSFETLQLFYDGSGVANSRFEPWAQPWVSLGGLVGPAVASLCLFVVGVLQRSARAVLLVLGFLCFALAFFVVQGAFALAFVVGLGVVLCAASAFLGAAAAQVTLLFLAVQLALSVFSRADYLFASTAKTGAGEMPSDVAQVATQWGGPILVWGSLIGVFSVFVLVLGLGVFALADRVHARVAAWRARRRQAQRRQA